MIQKLADYEQWNKFTVKELKNELATRTLPISGKRHFRS
jgi:hypothetical protein